MRILLAAAAAATLLAVPASAQRPRPSDKVREMAPALDRTAEALLNVDLGPLLDALDPGRPHPERTLRDLAGRGDPDFDRRLHASIYGNPERIGRAAYAMAAAAPALRGAVAQVERDMDEALDAGPPPPPPGDPDEDYGPAPAPDDDEGPPPPDEPN
jgi:hypothetical protein